MDDAEIAKALLVNGDIKPVVLDVVGEPTVKERLEQMDYNSFEPRYIYRIELEFETYDEGFNTLGDMREGVFFTDWHIKNQDIQRSQTEFVVYDRYKIYKKECIHAYISHTQYIHEPITTNPFEINSMNFTQPQVKIVGLKGLILMSIDEPIAKVIIPGMDKLYFTQKDRL